MARAIAVSGSLAEGIAGIGEGSEEIVEFNEELAVNNDILERVLAQLREFGLAGPLLARYLEGIGDAAFNARLALSGFFDDTGLAEFGARLRAAEASARVTFYEYGRLRESLEAAALIEEGRVASNRLITQLLVEQAQAAQSLGNLTQEQVNERMRLLTIEQDISRESQKQQEIGARLLEQRAQERENLQFGGNQDLDDFFGSTDIRDFGLEPFNNTLMETMEIANSSRQSFDDFFNTLTTGISTVDDLGAAARNLGRSLLEALNQRLVVDPLADLFAGLAQGIGGGILQRTGFTPIGQAAAQRINTGGRLGGVTNNTNVTVNTGVSPNQVRQAAFDIVPAIQRGISRTNNEGLTRRGFVRETIRA